MNDVTPRRKIWANVLFWYSCLSVVLCGVVHVVVALLGRPELLFDPDNVNVWWGLIGAHLLVFCLTFGTKYGGGEAWEPGWPPVLDPSPGAVRFARVALLATAGNFGYWVFRFVRNPEEHEISSVLSAVALLSAVTLAIVWGLRAESVFWHHYVALMRRGNPTMTLPASVLCSMGAKRRAIPFAKWMSGLLKYCELAAKSTSTVRDATDCDDPRIVDCVEFTSKVLDELESRACLIHYRDRLSDEGHRAIRRFIHSAESIQCRSPEPLKWQNIINDAKAVLAMRDTLLNGDALQRRN
jgi:hypothetical protein